MSYYHVCGECVLRTNETQCNIFKRNINLSDRACPGFVGRDEVVTCAWCGTTFPTKQLTILISEGNQNQIICSNCASHTGTCATCLHGRECAFENDPSPLPKIVQKVVQQGPMKTVTQVKNPDRIAITCAKGCPCYDAENGCLPELDGHTCGNYTLF
jgi:hypothetical protein